ncbi:uncharacterized protein LOC106130488 [Amyelois transitella]|uniref:uncharacterized protein LOC106130488 n=1 Tax=Amyelois transitella TaxID=680683 RepID=UPI00298F8F68|nr:uncharacterized protein LOC106130488 [Amyelois transitella]
MASDSTVSSCTTCDLVFNSVDSLEVHLIYHKENLFAKWGTNSSQNGTDSKIGTQVQREATVSALAVSSGTMITKPSPEFSQRNTPETSNQFPHPATPQSYHSAPSPYQNPDQNNFSPAPQFSNNFSHSGFSQSQHSDQINWDQPPNYHNLNRFHPYGVQEQPPKATSASPLYSQSLNQPTPSPSPNRCDKCGFVCESAIQLNEHCNSAHPGASSTSSAGVIPFQQYPPKQYNNTGYQNESAKVKDDHEESSDILDLDSQKVVYQGNEGESQASAYEDASAQGRDVNTRAVPMMPWDTQKIYSNAQLNGDVSLFNKEQKMFAEQKGAYQTDTNKVFHPDQKFAQVYTQEKFLSGHHEQKPFMHVEQKIYSGVQMPSLAEYPAGLTSTNPDMKPPYRPYDSPSAPQISSTQSANPSSTTMPSIGGKGANWKSNEARRPKTYNCTACNKWFTSSGHLKRHYNTTLHKNAVRSSGQPDPATMPISSHHHPSRDSIQNRVQQQSADSSNTQSPVPSEDGRGVDDVSLQQPYAAQNFDRVHRVAAMQSKTPYPLQGNLDNNFGNNPLANHPLQHQVGSHSLNIGSQPPGIGNPNDNNLQGPKGAAAVSSPGNPPNGEAGPSVSQSHHMRGLLSVSTSNITAPALTQNSPALTAHTLPPFSHLGVNPYSTRSTEPLGPSVPDPTHTPLYLGQNFQQTIAPNYPNGMAPHVMDMAINNLPIANPATFGESAPEIREQETLTEPAGGRLPSFAQLQTPSFSVYVSNFGNQPNVGGHAVGDDSTAGYIIVDPLNSQLQYNNVDLNAESMDFNFSVSPRPIKQDNAVNYTPDNIKLYPYGYAVGGKTIKRDDDFMRTNSSQLQILKIEDIMDYANKENYSTHMKSPASPESAQISPRQSPVSTTIAPLVEHNQLKKASPDIIHKCYECDKIFNKACYLTQHNKSFHSGEKPFKCDRCGKRFPDDSSYEEHVTKHSHDKPFKCPECPKSFNHKTDLRRHMCLHSGCKPFACEHCGKGFIRKDHMVKHCDTHKKKMRSSSAIPATPPSASCPNSPSSVLQYVLN